MSGPSPARMDANALIHMQLDAAPELVEPWLHALALAWTSPTGARYVVGPPTRTPGGPTPYETLAIYRIAYVADAAQTGAFSAVVAVALAVTYVPLRPSRACLELRAGPFLPATLDTVVQQCATAFALQYPVVSSVAVPLDEAGARPLACNRWLDDQLARLGETVAAARLYPAWLAQYRALRGDDPADPQRSFRAAMQTARRRLRRAARASAAR